MVDRNELRKAIFDSKNRKLKSETIEIFGQEVEVRQPTIAQINDLANRTDSKIPALIHIMVEYCYVPGTDEKVFSREDADTIAELPTGQWLNDLNQAIEKLSGINTEEATKNSKETA